MVTMTGHEDIEPFPGSRAFAVDDPEVSFIFEGPWGKSLDRAFLVPVPRKFASGDVAVSH